LRGQIAQLRDLFRKAVEDPKILLERGATLLQISGSTVSRSQMMTASPGAKQVGQVNQEACEAAEQRVIENIEMNSVQLTELWSQSAAIQEELRSKQPDAAALRKAAERVESFLIGLGSSVTANAAMPMVTAALAAARDLLSRV